MTEDRDGGGPLSLVGLRGRGKPAAVGPRPASLALVEKV